MIRTRTAPRRKARFVVEQLEDRSVPAAALTFVNDNWVLIQDNGDNILSTGDMVRNDLDTTAAGTITGAYGSTAFGTVTQTNVSGVNLGGNTLPGSALINDGISNTTAGGVVNVLQGTYGESPTVTTGVTLVGAGTITGTLTVNSGGIINPGKVGVAGTLTVTNLTVASGGQVTADLNGITTGAFDQLSASGTVDVTNSTLVVNTGTTIPAGIPLTILNNTGGSAITGTFTGLAEGAIVSALNTGQQFRISYVGGTGNDVTLTALPTLSYFNDNWAFVTDADSSGSLTQGDLVRNLNDTINAGGVTATYGVDAYGTVTTGAFTGSLAAFDSITEAIANTSNANGVVNVLEGAYTENVAVPSGITLAGNGTITGTVTVNSGGAINPGGVGTAGTLTVSDLTVASGGKVVLDLNGTTAGTFDQLAVTGTATVAGATLVVNAGAAIPVNSVLIVLNNTGGSAIGGTFAGLLEGATLNASNGQQFKISYVDGDGNDITLTAMTPQTADLTITKTDNQKFAFSGGQTSYTIVVTNNGSGTVTGVQVSDPLPAELTNATWKSVSAGGATGSAGTGTGSINEAVNLPPGASITYTLTATVTAAARGGLTNTATVATPTGATEANTADNTASDRDTVLPKAVPAFLHQFVVAGANGLVRIYNADGSLRAQGPPLGVFGYTGPVRLALGDLTGDGVQDFVFTATQGPLNGLIEVIDGAALQIIDILYPFPGFQGGLNLAIGDVNGDGFNDLVLATAFGTTQVQAYDIATNALLANFIAFQGFRGGLSLAVADVDGVLNANGLPTAEIIVGTQTGGSTVGVFNAGGQLLDSFISYTFPFTGGIFVAAGDIRGNDGKAEILIAPAGPGSGGLVELFGYKNHTPIASANLAAPGNGPDRGVGIAIRDIDGDGDLDLILASRPGRGSLVLAFNSRTGALLRNFEAFPGTIGGVEVG